MLSVLWGGSAWAVLPATPDWEVSVDPPWLVVVLDMNGDGFSDIVTTDETTTNLFYGSAAGTPTVPETYVSWTETTFPTSSSVGDFDGDGIDDLALSSGYGNWIKVWSGSPSGLTDQPSFQFDGNGTTSVADVNGDGADELVFVPLDGEALVFAGDPTGLSSTPTWTLPPGCDDEAVGLDANGDGFGDLVLGCAPDEVKLYLGSASGLSTEAAWTGVADNLSWYSPLFSSGDFDADGFDDLVVKHDHHYSLSVFPGSATGLQDISWSLQYAVGPYAEFLAGLGAGDLDADGDQDLAIGVPDSSSYRGLVALFEGDPAGLGTAPTWTWEGDGTTHSIGSQLVSGDINGDGADDLVVVSLLSPTFYEGVLQLFYGTPRDEDGDGFSPTTDCDDNDPTISPEVQEVDGDGLDQDCDGRDAGLGIADLASGALRITEVMREPAAVDRSTGQWFEIEVATEAAVDLIGLSLEWGDGEASVENFLVLSPGDRLVVGIESDPGLNGGAPVQLALPGLALDAVLQLSAGGMVVDELDLDTLPSTPGVAAQLVEGVWCPASRPYGAGDLGTPGQPNDPCAEEEEDKPVEKPEPPSEGCGCQGAPFPPGPAALLILALGARRHVGRRRPWARSCTATTPT